jgi:hypothetical protein
MHGRPKKVLQWIKLKERVQIFWKKVKISVSDIRFLGVL